MLVEQVFRNMPEDARWSIKPLCLGLGGGLRLRSLSVRRCAAVQPRGRRRLERSWLRPRARDTAGGRVGGAQSRLDLRDRAVAARRFPLDRVAGVGSLPAVHGGSRLLRPLLRRELGAGAAGRVAVRRAARTRRHCLLRIAAGEAAGHRKQAFLQLSLRLSRRVAALHPGAVGPRRTAASSGRTSSRDSPKCWKARPEDSGCRIRPAVISRRPRAGTCRRNRRRSPPTARSCGSWPKRAGS